MPVLRTPTNRLPVEARVARQQGEVAAIVVAARIVAALQQHVVDRGGVGGAAVHATDYGQPPRSRLAVSGHLARPREKALEGRSVQCPALPTTGSPMDVQASNFKAYDIRGIVGKGIDEAFAEHLGRAFGTEAVKAGEKAVAVGRDGRLSGPGLVAALMRGLASTGLDVVDLGAVTTPMLYYVAATRGRRGCHSGIQVTGSHNPKDYNGFKMVLAGRAIYGEEIQGLRRRMEAEDYVSGEGRIGEMDIGEEYLHRIVNDCKLKRPLKIVVDSGNGIPGASAPGILRALGCEVIELYSEVDGDFPNHHPGSEQAGKPGRADPHRQAPQGRPRTRLRRRRRPPRASSRPTATSSIRIAS